MTGRELLIVGVAVPLVVGLVLLEVEYSFFKGTSDLKTVAMQTVEKLEGYSVEPKSEPSIEPDVEDLNTLLKLADKVHGPSARNADF